MTPEGGSDRSSRWWSRHRDLIAAVGVGAAIVGVIVAVLAFGRDDSSQPPGNQPGPVGGLTSPNADSRAEEIETREFWANPPQMFDVPETFDTEVVNLATLGGDLEAFTPAELVELVAQYDYIADHTFFLAGRVVDTSFRRSEFGLEREYTLVGADTSAIAVLGAPDESTYTCCFDPGDVIYAIVRLTALGDTTISGRERRGVYVVTTDDYTAEIEHVESRTEIANIGSRELRTRLEALWSRR